jgi:GntR family transcriptional regulator/MocR family aminotransferase
LAQAVTAEFIESGHFSRHVRQMRLLYGARRDLLRQQIRHFAGLRKEEIVAALEQLARLAPD